MATIRLAVEDDLPAINAIYKYYVETSTSTYQFEPETDDDRRQWFEAHGDKHPVTVAEVNGAILGWGGLSPFRPRFGYRFTVEFSVYVRHDRHRQGVGRAILEDLIARAKELGYHTIVGGASADQIASIALQQSMGFRKVGTFQEVGNKFDRWLDVVFMQLML